jgi:hypothetical protein
MADRQLVTSPTHQHRETYLCVIGIANDLNNTLQHLHCWRGLPMNWSCKDQSVHRAREIESRRQMTNHFRTLYVPVVARWYIYLHTQNPNLGIFWRA